LLEAVVPASPGAMGGSPQWVSVLTADRDLPRSERTKARSTVRIVGNGFTRLCDAWLPDARTAFGRQAQADRRGSPIALGRHAEHKTVREPFAELPRLTRDVELLACETACEDYYEREVDEGEWQAVSAPWRPP
jgi:hypothetical protein